MDRKNKASAIFIVILACVLVLFKPISAFALSFQPETAGNQAVTITRLVTVIEQEGASGGSGDSWKEEFERICAQTEIATSLTADELRKLVVDSENLLSQLSSIEDTSVKIYIFRTKKCLDFFRFSLEWREGESQVE